MVSYLGITVDCLIFIEFESNWSTYHHSLFDWTLKSILTSVPTLHMVVVHQDVSRGRTLPKAKEMLEMMMTSRWYVQFLFQFEFKLDFFDLQLCNSFVNEKMQNTDLTGYVS